MAHETTSGRRLPDPTSPSDPTRRTAAIRIPFPARLNPHAERARQHTLQWVQETGLLTGDEATAEYDTLRLERLMAYFYPDASAGDLELAADFNAWFFIFDDQFDGGLGTRPHEIRGVVDALVGTMTTDGAPRPADVRDTPLVRAFRDIWLRSTAGAPYAWRLRFRDHWQAYLAAHVGEAHHRNADRLPSLEQFLEVRRHSIGVQPCLDFTERCGGYALPDELYRSFPLREMREITGDVVIFVNDIVSLVKELAAGDINNSVVIEREHKGCTLEESVEHITALANARTARFARLAASLPGTLADLGVPAPSREHVSHYVDGMRHVMAGNLSWSLATSRYDETGIAAVSGGRRRPWDGLTTATGTASPRHPRRA
ncbi:isoafricanol synthase [Streptomyces pristinaespiralis]|uniref:Pristinol synthase n=2 Tax=Streptomyces pristinaespiralis TaxID=38300 RepID=PRISS_STRE2|nr:isoafricanol synthase [Streptomyces pristinaespiralis]B5H7H3.1 RecName: Full=Pristinol synthase; AltName: Full=Terpene synthase; AltName: Full=Type I terpene cyclase [Streptomyces pristinaespiralis ATCC 25486]ALC24844.1 pentalenene synthase [Streptomyces pristinaespiralis]EDY62784.1 pentalenene synthase [Streptomyces pristinaespiralis ATCC 25486]QMU12856.1 pentalenene synthase [Streptomyces pristinaespiralis]